MKLFFLVVLVSAFALFDINGAQAAIVERHAPLLAKRQNRLAIECQRMMNRGNNRRN
jgi:hypothetical protein